MRKLLDTKAGGTFHREAPNVTMVIKKDTVELIYKLQPGTFMIIHALRVEDDKIMLFANWGKYFDRLQNPQVQIPQIGRTCPTLHRILVGDDEAKEINLSKSTGDPGHGIGQFYKVTPRQPLFTYMDTEMINRFIAFAQKNLDIYRELKTNPPFPAWKTGLEDLWN